MKRILTLLALGLAANLQALPHPIQTPTASPTPYAWWQGNSDTGQYTNSISGGPSLVPHILFSQIHWWTSPIIRYLDFYQTNFSLIFEQGPAPWFGEGDRWIEAGFGYSDGQNTDCLGVDVSLKPPNSGWSISMKYQNTYSDEQSTNRFRPLIMDTSDDGTANSTRRYLYIYANASAVYSDASGNAQQTTEIKNFGSLNPNHDPSRVYNLLIIGDSGGVSIYCDGYLMSSKNIAVDFGTGTVPLGNNYVNFSLASDANPDTGEYLYSIDDVKFYNYAVSAPTETRPDYVNEFAQYAYIPTNNSVNSKFWASPTSSVELDITANTFAAPVTLTVQASSTNIAPVAPGFSVNGVYYSIDVQGQTPLLPVTLKFEYDPVFVVPGFTPMVNYFNGFLWVSVPGTVDYLNHIITVTVNHFSGWVVGNASPTPTATPTPTPIPTRPIGYHGGSNIMNIDYAQAQTATLSVNSVVTPTTGVRVISAIPDKIILVTEWTISTNADSSIVLHYGPGAASNSIFGSNFIAGGYFPAGSKETETIGLIGFPAQAVNQGVYADFGAAITKVYVSVKYITY